MKITKNIICCRKKLLVDFYGVFRTTVIVPGTMRGDKLVCTADGVHNVEISDTLTEAFLWNFDTEFASLHAVAAHSCFNRDNYETVEIKRGRGTVSSIGKEGKVIIVKFARVEKYNGVINYILHFKSNGIDVSITNDGKNFCILCDEISRLFFLHRFFCS